MFTTTVKNIKYMGEIYEAGEVKISESDGTIGVSQLKKSFLSSKMLPLGQIVFNASTRLEVNGLKINIGDISFDVETSHALETIREIVTKPYRVERERKEKIITSADSSILSFLLERAKAIENLERLKSNPRETLLLSLDNVDEGVDPLTLYHKKLAESLTNPYAALETELESLKTAIDEKDMQRVYAMIYGVASVQTGLFSGGDLAKPLGLLEKVSSKKLNADNYIRVNLQEATNKLYNDASIMSPLTLLGERLA